MINFMPVIREWERKIDILMLRLQKPIFYVLKNVLIWSFSSVRSVRVGESIFFFISIIILCKWKVHSEIVCMWNRIIVRASKKQNQGHFISTRLKGSCFEIFIYVPFLFLWFTHNWYKLDDEKWKNIKWSTFSVERI